jgi:hypothetical protein
MIDKENRYRKKKLQNRCKRVISIHESSSKKKPIIGENKENEMDKIMEYRWPRDCRFNGRS